MEDGKVTIVGKDVDSMRPGGSTALAILVDVYGLKMQRDFESVLERRIHQFINYTEGAWQYRAEEHHLGPVEQEICRSGPEARSSGGRSCRQAQRGVRQHHQQGSGHDHNGRERGPEAPPGAMEVYQERDARLKDLTDEKVEEFYTCSMCQSFAPDHICIITPERLGLCGAINWLDAKASKEIAPTGPNQPLIKSDVMNEIKGQWKGVNDAVLEHSHHKLERLNMYTMMEDPMTSCGCFECVVAMTADAQAVIVVNREYTGMTPIGVKFSSLAGSVGGGQQTPGFMGVGRKYITSRKFIPADGGFLRIAWMPKDLKASMYKELKKRAEELGVPEFIDKIADETITTDAEGLANWMVKVDHPALRMPPLV